MSKLIYTRYFLILFVAMAILKTSIGQEETTIVERTFYDTRIINGHSVETSNEGVMKFIISHRFGSISNGVSDFFGLDDANMRLGIDYGIVNWLTIGIGRSSFEKTYDAYLKTKLLRQRTGASSFPMTITFLTSSAVKTIKPTDPSRDYIYEENAYYTFQFLMARKFGNAFSAQIMPTMIHRNFVSTKAEANDVFAIGVAPKLQISKTLTLNVEYYYVLPDQLEAGYYNSLAIGLDIETKGHVFQLSFGNSRGLIEKVFVAETTGQWTEGDIHFGFNITRDFKLKGRKYRKDK